MSEPKKDGGPIGNQIVVTMFLKNEKYEGEINTEESLITALYKAQRLSRDPIKALAYLAEIGFKHLNDPEHSISRRNRLGY